MALATSPLLRLLRALHRWLLRFHKPEFIGRALTGILCRLAFLQRFFRSKLRLFTTEDTKPPKHEVTPTTKDINQPTNNPISYTIIQHGKTISLDKASFSLYPFSSNGIRNTSRTSVRTGNPQSRSVSRSSHHPESNYSRSVAGSTYELVLHPIRPPSRRNPQRRPSTSMPDLTSPHLVASRQNWHPRPARSPTPELEIELSSPIGPSLSGDQNEAILHDRHGHRKDQRLSISPNQPYSRSSSPPPGIHVEPISPIVEVNSPRNISQTSLRMPSSSHGTLQPSENSYSSPEITPESVHLELPSTLEFQETHTIQPVPVLPDETLRYSRRTRTRKTFKNIEIEELTTVYDKPASPAGWIRLAHPEGACYYHNPEKRAYTDSHISDPEILERMMDDITRLERLKETLNRPFPQNAVVMIDVDRVEGDELRTTYYYADHDERAIFYLHPLEAHDIPGAYEINGVRSLRHLGYHMQAQYWHFVSLYPDSCTLTISMVAELRDIVLYLIGDTMTSPYSTSPYTLETLFQILNITSEMEKNALPGLSGCMGLFARHMYIFYHTRFLNFHGESFSRIERNFSVFGDPLNKRTWLVKTLSFFLFSAPDVHLQNLQKMWVDGIMHKSVWEQTMKNLNDEWQEFVFFATVMLTSNVGFLAIQSVDTDDDPFRSSAQILSYLSVVTNTGTLILGLLLMRQNRTKMKDTSDDVQRFLAKRNHPRLGLETLAILYSLPYALLMWGVVAFLAAFCCVFFQNSNVQTRSLVGLVAVAICVLILWCIVTSWETKEDTPEEQRPLSYEESQEPSEEIFPVERPASKYVTVFDRIRIPVLNYIRRSSVDSGKTVV